jgi:hypothetical protein
MSSLVFEQIKKRSRIAAPTHKTDIIGTAGEIRPSFRDFSSFCGSKATKGIFLKIH